MRLEDENIGDIKPFGVRMPSALKAKIKEAAKQNRHSMNAEIVGRLESSFERSEGLGLFDGLSSEQMYAIELTIKALNQANNIQTPVKPLTTHIERI